MNKIAKNIKQEKHSSNSYEPMFWNLPLDKGRLKSFVSWFLKNHGEKKTLEFLEELKILGFGYATKAGISLGIEDLKIPPNKAKLLAEAEFVLSQSNLSYRKGETTGIEKVQRFIETWNDTSESLKQEVVRYFEKTDILNPVYMMAFSGARGNLSQVRQLVGMRGLMSDPQGKIIDFPIQSNFREGLTLTEYLISTYGARKGIVDTALRTATAGYLTRRLVDVAQHVIVSKFDCGTQRGIFLFDMKEGLKTIYSFQNRLTGRVLAQNIYDSSMRKNMIAYRNQEITPELAESISKVTKKALVRSPLTCETRKLVCQLCYGWSLATSKLVSIGETVGVIAGQSIGEPGTQLTMRTFHTGGVFAANVAQQINAPFSGKVEYAAPIAGSCIRMPNGDVAFFTKTSGTLFLKKFDSETPFEREHKDITNVKTTMMNTYKIPAFTILFARHGQDVEKDSILAQISAATTGQKLTQTIEQTIYSSFEGEVYYNQIDILEDIDEKYGERISKAEDWSKVWVLSARILQNQLSSTFFPKVGDFVSKSSVLNQVQWNVNNAQKATVDLFSASTISLPSTEYSYLLKNQPFYLSSETVNSSDKEDFEQKTQKKSFQILSKYTLKSKFHQQEKFTKEKNVSVKSEYLFNKIPIEVVKTSFSYPYDFLIRSNSLKIVKQTFISLPALQPGILKTWLTSNPSMVLNQPKFSLSKPLNPNSMNYFVKKLNLNIRFRSYKPFKANFFHPLILMNSIPFTLEEKTLKSWFINKNRKKWVLNLSSETKMNSTKFLLNVKDVKSHFKSSNALPKHKELSLTGSLNTRFKKEKFAGHKFERLTFRTPFLLLKMKQLNYSRLGYFASVLLDSNQTNQFVSVFPLQNQSTLPSNQNSFYLNHQKQEDLHSFYKNLTRSQQLNSLNTYGLQNSYQWSLKPMNSFFWIPDFVESNKTGLFSIQNIGLIQETLYRKFSQTNVKWFKTNNLQSMKYLNLLNMSHSLISKKLKTEPELQISTKKLFSTSRKTKNGKVIKDSLQTLGIYQPCIFVEPKSSLSKLKVSQFSYKSSVKNIQKSIFKLLPEKNLAKLKTSSLNKEFDLKFPKHLNIEFNCNMKHGIDYNELYWIPEENYHFECFDNDLKIFKRKQKQGFFISKSKKGETNLSRINLLQTNAQGLKKPFKIGTEGFLKLERFTNLKNNSLKNWNTSLSIQFNDVKKSFVHQSQNGLKNSFLMYLKSLKFSQKMKNVKTSRKHQFNLISKSEKSSAIFTFIPYSQNRTLRSNLDHFKKSSSKEKIFKQLPTFKKKLKSVHCSLKPGWVYKTANSKNLFSLHKTFFNEGFSVLDDLSFEQNKVFVEIISVSEKPSIFQSSAFKNQNRHFSISNKILNKKSRFWNTTLEKRFSLSTSSCESILENNRHQTFCILIRPCYHRIFPTSIDMKHQLCSSMQKMKLKNFESSYFYYKQYFLSNLNAQMSPLKVISQFSSYDLDVEFLQNYSKALRSSDSKKDSMVKKTPKGVFKSFGTKQTMKEEKLKRLKSSTFFLFETMVDKKNSLKENSLLHKNWMSKMNCSPEYKKNSMMLKTFYLSNVPRSFSTYKISLRNLDQNSMDLGMHKIRFNSSELENLFFKKLSRKNDEKQLYKNYLNRLILRHQNKERSEIQNPLCFEESSAFNLKSFLSNFNELPFFEYSLEKNYNFFANQRLFASSFYKYQFKNSLKVPLFNDLIVKENRFQNQKFIQKWSEQNIFSGAFYDFPVLKNHLLFKNSRFGASNQPCVGFTNFYSPYEGEILKDYSKEKDKLTLKKGFNIHLDTANLLERQNQQLVLTKNDLISFPLYFNDSDFNISKADLQLSSSQNEGNEISKKPLASQFFESKNTKTFFDFLVQSHQRFQRLENHYFETLDLKEYQLSNFTTSYKNKNYLLKKVDFGLPKKQQKFRLGTFVSSGDTLYSNFITVQPGQVIHLNKDKVTLRKAEFFAISPKTILHTYNGHCLPKNSPVMTLPFETLKTGDIVQGIPKVEQYLEARTTIQGRLFLNSLPVLLYAIYKRYSLKLEMEKAVRQSFLKIQQILVDGIQRVYRSQGVSIADKHLEIIVRQMTSKVKIVHGGQTGFVAGELVDLEFVERINSMLMIKIRYEPVVLGITRASLEVDSFLSAASFQQTTKVLTKAALENKKDFLKGLKENLLVGNLLPAGTGYVLPILDLSSEF